MGTTLTRATLDDVSTLQKAATGTANGSLLDVRGAGAAIVQVAISVSATVTFEVSLDDSTWVSALTVDQATGAVAATTTATGDFLVPLAGQESFRARVSTFGSGTITVLARAVPIGPGASAPSAVTGTTTANQGTAGGSAWPVDTELPAAAALADNSANPTTPTVGAVLSLFGGSSNNDRVWAVGGLGTIGASGRFILPSTPFLQNPGAGYDQAQPNKEVTVLASASQTLTQTQADQVNVNHRGIHVILDMTVVGSGSVTLTIQGKDPVSGKYYTLLAGAAVVGNSTNVYKVYPGLPATANVSANDILPRTWRILVTANNANAATYSVGAILIR